MKLLQKHKWLGSSSDPNKLSLSIAAGIPFLVSLLALFGLNLDGAVIAEAVNQIAVGVSGVATLIGLGRKVYNHFKN